MNYQMDYFYGHEANQFTFFRIPKLLFSDERFIGLSSDAKILYGLMLDRMGLSVKNGWIDEKNHVYIYFTLHVVCLQVLQAQNGCEHPFWDRFSLCGLLRYAQK